MELPRPQQVPGEPLSPEAGAVRAPTPRGVGALAARLGLPSDMRIPAAICAILSGVMTWINVGFIDGFAWRWLTGFLGGLPMMVVGMKLMRTYDRLLLRWMHRVSELPRRLVRALMMTLTMESLMTSVVTLRNIGWVDGYSAAWATAFMRSLPVGLCIGLLMSFVIGPRLRARTEVSVTTGPPATPTP